LSENWPQGYGLAVLDEIDSTNAEARRRAASGEAGPLWIMAMRQSAGRGRRGRVWQSPPGNLAATLLLRPGRPAGIAAQLSFVAAIACADMVAGYTDDVAVKWPNDVLAGGRKIAGILLEAETPRGEATPWLAVGIGVNLAHFPPDTEYPAVSLAALGAPVPGPRAALDRLAASFAKWYDLWRAQGFAPIRDAWLARAGGLGTRIRARLQNEEALGVFEGIDETGALLLGQGQGRPPRAIAAGEVFFA
jgi:BirA family biotin operon repressor/biotin-[acetyl-CoA-carboxylase] ligase